MPVLKLQSSEGEVIPVDVEVAAASGALNSMIEALGIPEDDDEIVPLPNVNSAILKKVVAWADHHKSTFSAGVDPVISPWDDNFLNVHQATLYDLILAANYLDVKGLLDVTCKKVADLIKGKEPAEIRATFNISDDFTQEENEQIRRECKWLQ